MSRKYPTLLMVFWALFSLACYAKDGPREVEWLELMPKEDQEALAALPPVSHVPIADFDENGELIFERPAVFSSTNVVPELNKKNIKIAGFIVPVETTEDWLITEFFLVPYFGACIHVPPPPPNQIIYVKYKKGLDTDTIADPFWVSGTLLIENVNRDIAQSSYSLLAEQVEVYEEEESP